MENLDIDAYLLRIGVAKQTVSSRFLKELHRGHLLNIPYENLDFHYGKPKIQLKVSELFNKVIKNKRGGISYELNILFYHLLHQLGFDSSLISATIGSHGVSPGFDHPVVLIENLDGSDYICDIGHYEFFHSPKALKENYPQLDHTKYYQFIKDVDENWILKVSNDNNYFLPVYSFQLEKRGMIEFIPRCNQIQEDKGSSYYQTKLISKLFTAGRITLTDKKLISHIAGEITESDILNEDEFFSHLEQYFQISRTDLFRQEID